MSIVNIEALKQMGCQLWWPGSQSTGSMTTKAITANGDCKQLLPFSGAGIGMFDGTGDYLSIPNSTAFDFSSGDYTFEFYISFADLALRRNIMSKYTDDSNLWQVYFHPTTGMGFVSQVSGSWTVQCTQGAITGWSTNTLYHIAIVHSGTTYTMYRNGISIATVTDADNIPYLSGSPLYIGTGPFESAGSPYYKLNGNLSELRISNVARYTAAFTPPRRQLESDANTKLLLHFNRNDTTFIDSSSSAHTIAVYGDAKQLCSPCGSGVTYFDGTGDYLTLPSSTDFNFGSGNFSIGCWVCPTIVNSAVKEIISGGTSGGYTGTSMRISTGNKFQLYGHDTTQAYSVTVTGTTTVVANTWYWVVISRTGNIFKLYVNGTQEGGDVTFAYTLLDSSANYRIGRHGVYSTGYEYAGYISDFIIIKGANLSPTLPTQPFAPDPNTKLLLHMDGTGNAFYDSSDRPGDHGFVILPAGVTVTPSGTFTSVKGKDGRNYYTFDKSTNLITLSNHSDFSLGADYSVALWFRLSDNTTNLVQTVYGYSAPGEGGMTFALQIQPYTNKIWLYHNSDGVVSTNWTYDPDLNWHHLVVVRSAGVVTCYVDRVSIGTWSESTSISISTYSVIIGKFNAANWLSGNIKDFMLFKGKALSQDQIAAIMQETFIY